MKWYFEVFRKYADFTGRARREEYWMYTLFNFLASMILLIILAGVGYLLEAPAIILLFYVYVFATILPTLGVVVRRLHDIGKSGWYYLAVLIPIAGPFIVIVWFCTDSEPGKNQWGDNPKGISNDLSTTQRSLN